ncbi:PqqD family peptide modification chaperone [Streptomyces sp. NPDC004393]
MSSCGCATATDVDEIVAALGERFPGAPVASEVPRFLSALRKEGWLL